MAATTPTINNTMRKYIQAIAELTSRPPVPEEDTRGKYIADIFHNRVVGIGKLIDDRVNKVDQNHRRNHGEGNLPEGLPGGCAVDRAGLINRRGNGLQTGKEDQQLNARAVHDAVDVVHQIRHILHQPRSDLHAFENLRQIVLGSDL